MDYEPHPNYTIQNLSERNPSRTNLGMEKAKKAMVTDSRDDKEKAESKIIIYGFRSQSVQWVNPSTVTVS